MQVIWSEFTEKQLDEIFTYYVEHANHKIGTQILQDLLQAVDGLKDNPEMGQAEDLLKKCQILYRYIIHKNYKIIYSVDQKTQQIKVANVFISR